jgi:hypothetical protein
VPFRLCTSVHRANETTTQAIAYESGSRTPTTAEEHSHGT